MTVPIHDTLPVGVEFDEAHYADIGILKIINGGLYQLVQDVSGDEYYVKVEDMTVPAEDINP